jgi:glycosyltransferase involved in cell wall biosynthesis
MPGGVGLGVLDSFGLRVPLVTTAIPSHGPEIEYLRDGVNGLVVDGASDPSDYAADVVATLRDPELRERLRHGCAQSSAQYTVEAMVDNFADGVRRALCRPPAKAGRSRADREGA